MTQEEINKVAQEYAEAMAKLFPELKEKRKYRDKIAQAINVIHLLLCKYNITPKDNASKKIETENEQAHEYKVNETKRVLHLIREPDIFEKNLKLFCAEDLEAAFKSGAEYTKSKQSVTIEAWVARDKNGFLAMHDTEPEMFFAEWISCHYIGLRLEDFPSVTWENSPKKVKVTIELEEK